MVNLKATRDIQTGRWFLEGVEHESITYDRMIQNLKEGVNFKFARYGDGELFCMTGKNGHNCDKHKYFPDMGIRLVNTIMQAPDYMVGIQPLSVHGMPQVVEAYFGHFGVLYNADVLHSASIDGKLGVLFNALEGRYIILVGPSHLADLFDGVHLVIPDLNCWLYYQQIKEQIAFHLQENAVVLFCASMMSEVLISDFKDKNCTMIDCGSVFDPYCNVKSRSYHHKLRL